MTTIPTIHIPARELHHLLDLAGYVPSQALTDEEFDNAIALIQHWRSVTLAIQPDHTHTLTGRQVSA